jgi:hypothetical protein
MAGRLPRRDVRQFRGMSLLGLEIEVIRGGDDDGIRPALRVSYKGTPLATISPSAGIDVSNATATPTANAIPKADASGKLAAGWGGGMGNLATLTGLGLVAENGSYTAAGEVGTVWATEVPGDVKTALDRIAAALATHLTTPIP